MSEIDPKGRKGLLLVMMDIPPEHEDEFNRWYKEEHLPERRACSGFLSCRRFRAVEGGPKYLAIYDLESADTLNQPGYQAIKGPTDWTQRISRHFQKFVRNVYVEIDDAGQ